MSVTTIIIPTYNSIGKMQATISSLELIEESFEHEVIFVDDCSNDETHESLVAIAERHRNWRVLKLDENSGSAARPRNVGIAHAAGDYLFFLDADDEIIASGLKQAVAYAEKFGSDVVRSSILAVGPDGSSKKVDAIPKWDAIKDPISRLRAVVKYQSLTCSTLIKRDLILDNDITFDESRRIGEDICFTAKVLAVAEKIAYRDASMRKYIKSGSDEESVTQRLRDSDFRDFFLSWDEVEATLSARGISFMKEHGRAALLYALRQYVWFKTEDICRSTFLEFSDFLNRHWVSVREYSIPTRYAPIVKAAQECNYEEFLEWTRLRLLVAGHDLKFMGDLMPFLNSRFVVSVDKWSGHTEHDELQSRYLLERADYIWIEWLLGAAVWYSKNKRSDQRLIVRTHRSEMTVDYGLKVQVESVSKFIAIAPHCLGDFSDRFDIPRSKFALVPNAFDVTKYAQVESSEVVYRLAMVGIVPALKGFHKALRLLKALGAHDDRYQLHIYGKKPDEYSWVMRSESARRYYESCEEYIRENNLESRVVYEGWVNPKEHLKNVGFVLSLSDYEGMQVAPGEAFCASAQGLFLPWRGVEACYPSEFIFPSLEEMATHILQSQDFDVYSKYAEMGRAFMEERFALDDVQSQLERLLLSVRA